MDSTDAHDLSSWTYFHWLHHDLAFKHTHSFIYKQTDQGKSFVQMSPVDMNLLFRVLSEINTIHSIREPEGKPLRFNIFARRNYPVASDQCYYVIVYGLREITVWESSRLLCELGMNGLNVTMDLSGVLPYVLVQWVSGTSGSWTWWTASFSEHGKQNQHPNSKQRSSCSVLPRQKIPDMSSFQMLPEIDLSNV